MAGKGFTVREIFIDNKPVKAAAERAKLAVSSPFPASVGDAVFKVSSETAFTMSENACLKRLEAVKAGKMECDLSFALQTGELVIAAEVAGIRENISFKLPASEPSSSAMADVFSGQFSKCGDTPFILGKLDAEGFPAIMIPPAVLKEIRRDFSRELESRIRPQLQRHRDERRRAALASLPGKQKPATTRRPELVVRVDRGTELHLLQRDGVDILGLPLSRANLHQLPQITRKLRGREERIIWRLPFMIFDEERSWYREAIGWLAEAGFKRFEAANIGHFRLLREIAAKQPEISTDYRLFSLNSVALEEWRALGAAAATLYIEDDGDNMAELLKTESPLLRRVVLHCEVPAIVSKIAIKAVKNDAPVLSDRGDGYRVTVRDGLTQITPTRHFAITQFRDRLQAMGCSAFILDLASLEKPEQERVLAAYASGRELPDSSPFNFISGLV